MLEFTRRDKWSLGAIYSIPIACLGAALGVAFTHAKGWVARHNDGAAWEHWAFAIMIELPALFGLLLLALWPKIGAGRKPIVPRLLFLLAVVLSFYVQQAYAGSDASMSERFVAGAPSVLAGIFLELVFWVMGLVEEAKEAAKREAAGPPPALVPPPPPMVIPGSPLAPVPPSAPVSTPPAPPERDRVSPWTSPPGTPVPLPPDTAPDAPADVQAGQGDNAQVTATVPPTVPPSSGGEDMGGQDLPGQPDNDEAHPTESGGHGPQDTPEEDTAQEGDTGDGDPGTAGLVPLDLETWEHHRNGMGKKDLAVKYGCSEKTIQRRLSKVRAVHEAAAAAEGEPANA